MKHDTDLLPAVAVLRLRDASQMTEQGRAEVAEWLRKEANDLLSMGEQYSDRYQAKYLINEENQS